MDRQAVARQLRLAVRELTAAIRSGETYELDLRKAIADAGDWATPEWQKIVKRLYQRADGYVRVERVDADRGVAMVFEGHLPVPVLSSIQVPLTALTKVTTARNMKADGSFFDQHRVPEVGRKVWVVHGFDQKVAQGVVEEVYDIDRKGYANSYIDVRVGSKVLHVPVNSVFPEKPKRVSVTDEYGETTVWR